MAASSSSPTTATQYTRRIIDVADTRWCIAIDIGTRYQLCSGLVDFVIARNQANNIKFAALQSEVGRAMLKEVGAEHYADTLNTMILIDPGM
jgi:hypothetical protein